MLALELGDPVTQALLQGWLDQRFGPGQTKMYLLPGLLGPPWGSQVERQPLAPSFF